MASARSPAKALHIDEPARLQRPQIPGSEIRGGIRGVSQPHDGTRIAGTQRRLATGRVRSIEGMADFMAQFPNPEPERRSSACIATAIDAGVVSRQPVQILT